MAQVKWTLKADRLFEKYVFNAFLEYGTKTSKKWMQERIEFVDRVAKHPESYTLEPLLSKRKHVYRSKLLYQIDFLLITYKHQNESSGAFFVSRKSGITRYFKILQDIPRCHFLNPLSPQDISVTSRSNRDSIARITLAKK